MTSRSVATRGAIASTVALVTIALLAIPDGSGARRTGDARRAAAQLAAPGRVGALHIGDTVRSLHERHLIRGLRPGCELDPGQRVASLRRPLKGTAIFFHGGTRLSALIVTAGARTARGVEIGSTVKEARRAYPNAQYDPPRTVHPFFEGFIWVNRPRDARMTFTIDPESRLVSSIDVPNPAICE
jgi:hypothetical protein